jgi:DNA (cytosine-5)-methyltransferase 1
MAKKKIKKVRVRKLTERECFRLMGLKDTEIDKLVTSGISRGQLYKIAGNSIVVDVLENIFRTMFIEKNSEKGHSDALF